MIGRLVTLPDGTQTRVYGEKKAKRSGKAAYVDPATGTLADVVKSLVDAGLMENPPAEAPAPKRKPGRPKKTEN